MIREGAVYVGPPQPCATCVECGAPMALSTKSGAASCTKCAASYARMRDFLAAWDEAARLVSGVPA